jgi:DNA repair exonuclease SbcCD ATPase subunit
LAAMAIEVQERSETAQDVTEEYVDLQARLESLETARDRLLAIMEDAETTEDLLRAEQQLTQREAEIESIKGRTQYLTQSARLSQISVTLQPHILSQPIASSWRPAETAREAFEALVNSLRGLGRFLIYFSIAVVPWLVVIGLIAYGAARFVRWRRSAGFEEETNETPSPGE